MISRQLGQFGAGANKLCKELAQKDAKLYEIHDTNALLHVKCLIFINYLFLLGYQV